MDKLGFVLIGAIAGSVLGTIFFGGLWLTTFKGFQSRHNIAVVLSSFIGRLLFCLVGFYLVIRFMGLEGIIAAMGSFLVVQLIFAGRSLSGGRNNARN